MPYEGSLRGMTYWGGLITGESPCGEDLSLDPEFELLSDEIGKDKSLHGDQKTDWIVVFELSDSLLSRTKDLWPFSYGIVAVYHTKTVTDCANCVNSLTELLSAQWGSLHPSLKRPKRRMAPLKWMCDKFHSIADNTAFLNLSPKEIAVLNDAFHCLQDKLDALLPDNEFTFKSILRKQLGSSQENTAVSEQLAGAVQKPAAAASTPVPQNMGRTLEQIEKSSIIPSAALPQVIRTINENARQLGDHLLAINSEDERGYLLHRVANWGTLLQLPPSDANGLTQLSCPVPPDMIDMYTAGVNDKRYSEMLPLIERAASKAPFWIDGQHLIVKCLEGMSASLPAFSVKHALAQLVSRLPDILSLKFKDGRAFASPKTVTWVDSFIPVILGGNPFGGGAHMFSGGSAEADELKLLQDAIAAAGENDFKAGLEVLGHVPPGKSRGFLRHCILKARYCSAAGRQEASAHILKFMIDKLKTWDLLDWEPELTAEAVSQLLSHSSKQKEPDEELQSLLYAISLETAIATKPA